MRLLVVAVGRRVPGWAGQASEEFANRVRGDCTVVLKTVATSRRGDPVARMREEGEALLRAARAATYRVALALDGSPWNTAQLVERLRDWRAGEREVAFLIGGPDGLAPACLDAADRRWSLSPLTLPHALARVVVAEQLYRAWSVLQGHPYHR